MLRQRRQRWRQRRPLRARPLIHLVPNAFTVASICFGLTAIRFGLDGRFELAVVLIILAGVFDGLDGRAARLLKITSKIGAELDSLADFLSFGVAPAFLVYLWSLHTVPGLGWVLALLFVICMALRLARFNSELDDADRPLWMTRFFTGMPAPAAAGVVLMPMMLSFATGSAVPATWAVNAVVTVFVALMMVSRVPTFSIKMVMTRVKPEYVLPTLVTTTIVIAAMVNVPWWTLLTVGVLYVQSIPISVLVARRLRRQHERETAPYVGGAAPPAAPEPAPPPASDSGTRLYRIGGGRRGGEPAASDDG
jgi:CDP-diacylglycerol--serine O-phosphatidyltransferase